MGSILGNGRLRKDWSSVLNFYSISFIRQSIRDRLARDRLLDCPIGLWNRLLLDLRQRGGGRRESGAFLLASAIDPKSIIDYKCFDDLEPDCLKGNVELSGTAFAALWALCRARQLDPVGDVHTHPGADVRQSFTDRSNPLIANRGYVAIIVPHFAGVSVKPQHCGVHRYLGDRSWEQFYGPDARRAFYVGMWS